MTTTNKNTREPVQVVLVTTPKERSAVVKSWGDGIRIPWSTLSPTVHGLPLKAVPNFHVYLACAAMGIPGYEAVTIE